MATNKGKLAAGRNSIVPCRGCGRSYQTHTSDGALLREPGTRRITGMCPGCWDFAGWENQHSDEAHSELGADPRCPICKGAAK